MTDDPFLSRSEAARYFGVPPTTIYQWARSGRLPCLVTLGGHTRFRPADLDAANASTASTPRRRVGALRNAPDDQPTRCHHGVDGDDGSRPR